MCTLDTQIKRSGLRISHSKVFSLGWSSLIDQDQEYLNRIVQSRSTDQANSIQWSICSIKNLFICNYLLLLLGSDIAFNPVFFSYCVITLKEVSRDMIAFVMRILGILRFYGNVEMNFKKTLETRLSLLRGFK